MSKKDKKEWLATAPNAAQKIQEARIALGKMKETMARDAPFPTRTEFLLYFNQFQEACYSVTISLDKLKNGWRKNLNQQKGEGGLINFMLRQRGGEVHNASAQDLHEETKWHLSSGFKEVETMYFRAQYMPHDFGAPTHEVCLTEHYFENGTGRKEVIPTCDEYLAVLARQI